MNKYGFPQIGFAMIFAVTFAVAAGHAQNTVDLKTMNEIRVTALPGSLVSEAENAKHLAMQAYLDKMGGLRSTEWFECLGVTILGFPVPGFSQEEDKVWEVRVSDIGVNGLRTFRAILWVNPDTGKVHCVCGPWEQGGSEPPK